MVLKLAIPLHRQNAIQCLNKLCIKIHLSMYKNSDEVQKIEMNEIIFVIMLHSLYSVMNGRSSPVLFEFISVPICYGPSFPITGGEISVHCRFDRNMFRYYLSSILYVSAPG